MNWQDLRGVAWSDAARSGKAVDDGRGWCEAERQGRHGLAWLCWQWNVPARPDKVE